MKKVTTITVTAPKSGVSQVFDDYETFAMCIGFWYASGDTSTYYKNDDSCGGTYYKLYRASRDLCCKVERVLGGLTIVFDTDYK